MTVLGAVDGYRLWAPTYSEETVISHIESKRVAEATPPLEGLRLLDAGCGVGRRLRDTGAALAVGLDLSPDMLGRGRDGGERSGGVEMLVGDVRHMPLSDRAFDVVWCRLVIGHLAECATAYAELARVADIGARVIVTDFHPAAHAAGHRRTFRAGDAVYELEHHVHDLPTQLAAARAAGLDPVEVLDAAIGEEARPYYERAGRLAQFQAHCGLPVVLVLVFRRVR